MADRPSGSAPPGPDDLPDDLDDNPDWTDGGLAPLDEAGMLTTARARLGLTQRAAADPLGFSVATLRNWEQRRTTPDGPGRALIRLLHSHPTDIRAWLEAG